MRFTKRNIKRYAGITLGYLWLYCMYILQLLVASHFMYQYMETYQDHNFTTTILRLVVLFAVYMDVNHMIVKLVIPQKRIILIEVLLLISLVLDVTSYAWYLDYNNFRF